MIGILGALDVEVVKLFEELEHPVIEEAYGYRYASGALCGRDVVIAKCGVGKVNAAVCTQTMIMKYAPELIINTGVAGSLSKDLKICDIAVGRDVVQHDVDTTACGDPIGFVSTVKSVYFPCDSRACEVIVSVAQELGINAIPARIASGDQFIYEASRKNWIVNTFGAHACEMESGAIAQVCFISGIPCAIIRAISDSTDGEHGMEFFQFVEIAASNSIRVLKKALSSPMLLR